MFQEIEKNEITKRKMKSVRTYNVSQIHKRFQWIQMIISKQKEFYSSLVEIGESFSILWKTPKKE